MEERQWLYLEHINALFDHFYGCFAIICLNVTIKFVKYSNLNRENINP